MFKLLFLCYLFELTVSELEDCGRANLELGSTLFAITGDDSEEVKAPWIAAVGAFRNSEDGNEEKFVVTCSGTILSRTHVITAAHCFDDIRAPFTATVGGVQHRISTVLKNPCFSFKNDGPNGMDLALIKLDTPSSQPPQSIYRFNDEVGKTITLVGWGDLCVAGNHHPSNCRGGNRFRTGKNVINGINENTLQ